METSHKADIILNSESISSKQKKKDYTNKEREQYKILRAELKERTDKGEKKLII